MTPDPQTWIRRVALAAFALFLAIIIYATLSPLQLRPNTGHLHFERMTAYALLAGALCVAYPRHWERVLLITVFVAIGLEYAQTFDPGRDGRLPDAVEKIVGGGLGVLAGLGFTYLVAKRWPSTETGQTPSGA